jgi:hypothetical protein
VQGEPRKTKLKSFDGLGFIWPNRAFSTGYERKNKKIAAPFGSPVRLQATLQTATVSRLLVRLLASEKRFRQWECIAHISDFVKKIAENSWCCGVGYGSTSRGCGLEPMSLSPCAFTGYRAPSTALQGTQLSRRCFRQCAYRKRLTRPPVSDIRHALSAYNTHVRYVYIFPRQKISSQSPTIRIQAATLVKSSRLMALRKAMSIWPPRESHFQSGRASQPIGNPSSLI